jgi:transcriptional/translational regulatory protein YebC/TACO1
MSPFSPLRAPGNLRRHISDGGSVDPERNVALFNVIKKARAGGVPKANIESALQKVTNYFF